MSEIDGDWLAELFEYLRIPSVSAEGEHAEDVRRAAEWVRDFVRGAGGDADLVETRTHPLVVGEVPSSSGAALAPTVLLYGHVDVQPVTPLERWDSDPFEPEVRDGWIYARGAADDKGNNYLLLKATELLARAGELPVNIRIAFDGEEEVGGHSIVEFLEADASGADACLIFDSGMVAIDTPAFYIGTRGLLYFHVTLRSGEKDLHSGVFGGAALNAIHALMQTLRAVVPTPPELRTGALPPATEEITGWGRLETGEAVLASEGGRPADATAAEDFYLRTLAATAVDVNGIHGGEPDLEKTVLPVAAHANVSVRLAPGQDVESTAAAFERLLREAAPPGSQLAVELMSSSPAAIVPPDTPALRLAADAFERTLHRQPILLRTGGTLPIVPALAAKGIPTVLTGFDVPGGNIHSPNERLLARYVPLGVEAAAETLRALGGLGSV